MKKLILIVTLLAVSIVSTAHAGDMSNVDIFKLSAQQAFDKGQRNWTVQLKPGAILKKRFETTMLDITGISSKTHNWRVLGNHKKWRFKTWDRRTWEGRHYVVTFEDLNRV